MAFNIHAPKLHAPSRRELLLSSGVLFAWSCLPKRALAAKFPGTPPTR